AKINKPLTIVGADGLSDLKNATLTVTADNVTIKGIFKANVVITTAVKKLCTISKSALDTLSVSGCSIGNDSGLLLDSTSVSLAIFEQDDIDYSDLKYLSLTLSNYVVINELKCKTYLAIIDKDGKNGISSLSVEPNENYGSCVAALPSLYIANKSLNISTVNFYDSTLEGSDTPAHIDCMVVRNNTDSFVNRSFFIKACEMVLGNVISSKIQGDYIDKKIINDVSVDIPNMVDTVNITFYNNLPDATTDVRKIIKNGEYLLPTIQFDHADNVTLYGWSKNSGTNNQKHYDCDKVFRFSEDTDLYAVWKPVYTISYRDKDVTSDVTFDAWMTTSDWTEYVAEQNVVLPTSEDVTKDGYIFQGWYADKDYKGSAISGWLANTKTGNQTFYAKWQYCAEVSDILFRSGNEKMTIKWKNPSNTNLAKVSIMLNGQSYDVTADAGQQGIKKITGLTNGHLYTAVLTAVDNKGNRSSEQTIFNYCGSYIGTDGSLYIKGTKYEKTAMKTVIETSTDVTGDDTDGVFISGRTVTLSPYRIGQYEVTQKLYQAITGSNPSSHIGDNYPVENVSRYDCLTMCRKLNELFGYENASANDETVDITKEGFR
ncbi:MAG: InlB B-repeat-containing protein, partial [Spirochaetales bacterium]|nr:InlB B-repeat-containing protein [Spirochaetales bacterium]